MIVRIIKTKDNGDVIKDTTYKQYTEKEWRKKYYKLRRTAKGHVEVWHHGNSCHRDEVLFYTEKEVLPMTDREKKRERAKRREHRKEVQARKEEKKRLEQETELKTAWQWLRYDHRKPADTAKPIEQNSWYYYYWRDTTPTTEEEYQRLKDLYVKKFGGWEDIGLEHTTYDGHKWW